MTRPKGPPGPPRTPYPPAPPAGGAPAASPAVRVPAVPPPAREGNVHGAQRVRAGALVAGRYRLERVLRQGGMGSVWIARHLGLEVHVAIKFMTASAGGAHEPPHDRFAREAKLAAQIRSSNVVKVLDHGIDDGLPYIVMELLEGEDLGRRLRRVGRVPLDQAAMIVGAVARGLKCAHDLGLVHRDLKPENVFLAREGDQEVPKILDFGVAKSMGPGAERAGESTREGMLVGTPHFMSPEQARGRADVDHRSDLWSLGVIAFRAITGRRPFESDAIGEVIVQICSEPIPSITSLSPELPPEVDGFFVRALSRDRNERFQSARELAQAFAELVPQPSATPPPSLRVSAWPGYASGSGGALPVPTPVPEQGPHAALTPPSLATPPPTTAPPTPPAAVPSPLAAAPAAHAALPVAPAAAPYAPPSGRGVLTLFAASAGLGVCLAFGLSLLVSRSSREPPPAAATSEPQADAGSFAQPIGAPAPSEPAAAAAPDPPPSAGTGAPTSSASSAPAPASAAAAPAGIEPGLGDPPAAPPARRPAKPRRDLGY